jgi:uncharacterized protein YdhG (YjbR/CyaY superfamily)
MTTDPRVDAYLAAQPAEHRRLLQALRDRLAAAVPDGTETISYGMPAVKLGDRFLVSYAGWKRHCSIYPVHDDLLADHEEAIRGYVRTKGSLHFGARQPLPDELLDDLVRSRVATVLAGGR